MCRLFFGLFNLGLKLSFGILISPDSKWASVQITLGLVNANCEWWEEPWSNEWEGCIGPGDQGPGSYLFPVDGSKELADPVAWAVAIVVVWILVVAFFVIIDSVGILFIIVLVVCVFSCVISTLKREVNFASIINLISKFKPLVGSLLKLCVLDKIIECLALFSTVTDLVSLITPVSFRVTETLVHVWFESQCSP